MSKAYNISSGYSIKFPTQKIIAFLVIILMNQPSAIGNLIPGIKPLFRLIQLGIMGILLVLYVLHVSKTGKLNISLVVLALYYFFVYGYSALLNSSSPQFSEAIIGFGLALYFLIMIDIDMTSVVKSFSVFYLAVALIQAVLVVRYPYDPRLGSEGIAYNWLFYNRNHMIRYFLPGFYFVMMRSKIDKNKYYSLISIVYTALVAFIIFSGGSATGKIVILFFIVMTIVFVNKKMPLLLSVDLVALYSLLFFVLIFAFKIQYYFEYFIVDVLGKNIEFSGRTIIWEKAMATFREHFIIGVGAYDDMGQFLGGWPHTHQYWLQQLVSGGIVGFLLLSLLIVLSSYHLRRKGSQHGASLLNIIICAFFVAGIDEALTHAEVFLPLLVLASTYKKFSDDSPRVLMERYIRLPSKKRHRRLRNGS